MRVQRLSQSIGVQEREGRSVGRRILDAVHTATDYLDDHPLVTRTIETSMTVARGLKTFPDFIYPSVFGATAQEREQIYSVLDGLPLQDVNSVKSITMVGSLASDRPDWVINGRAHDQVFTNDIELSREQLVTPEKLRGTLTHEVGHTRDYESQWFGLFGRDSSEEPWGEGPYISDYAQTNPREDYAESFEEFHVDRERLRETAQEKYEYLERRNEQGLVERLIDREEFRETGKWIGDRLGPDRPTRNGVQALYYVSGFVQAGYGLDQLRKAEDTGSPSEHYHGMLNLASGALFATGLGALPGMVVQSAHRALNQGVQRGEIDPVDADAAVRVLSDPLERLGRAVGAPTGLVRPFVPLEERFPDVEFRVRRAGAIAAGGALGGLVGSMAGPYAGVLAGYRLAGAAGGAAGLVAGAIAGYVLGTDLGGRAGGAVVRALGG